MDYLFHRRSLHRMNTMVQLQEDMNGQRNYSSRCHLHAISRVALDFGRCRGFVALFARVFYSEIFGVHFVDDVPGASHDERY